MDSSASCRIAHSPAWLLCQVISPSLISGVLLTTSREVTNVAEGKRVAPASGMAAALGITLAVCF